MNITISPEIVPGKLVGLRRHDENEDVTKRLREWIGAYGRGPFLVCQRPDQEHVSLQDRGELVYFGSTECPLLHIVYVEIWRG
jgi:hypothetical protein